MDSAITDNKHIRYYYIRLTDGQPIGCVCLIRTDDNIFHRGISLCNFWDGDKFIKASARGIAYGRAIRAKKMAEDDLIKEPIYSNLILALSDLMEFKLGFIAEQYGLGCENDDHLLVLPMSTGNAELTDGEREMWKDFLDPNFVRGKFKNKKNK